MSFFRRWFGGKKRCGSGGCPPNQSVSGDNMASKSGNLAGGSVIDINKFTKQQQNALNQILQMGLQGLQQPGQADFAPIAQQAREQFQQQTVPSIAERFTQMGGQRSGAFARALGEQGAGLESALASMQSQHNLQRQNQLQQLLGMGLTSPFESIYRPPQTSLTQSVAPSFAQGLGMLLPSLAMKWATGGFG